MERGKKMARRFKVVVNGKEYIVEVEEIKEKTGKIDDIPRRVISEPKSVSVPVEKKVELPKESGDTSGEKLVKAPMAGIVVEILVSVGQQVKEGDKLLMFEAMKMENELLSEYSGRIKEIKVKEGDSVETGQVLMVIE